MPTNSFFDESRASRWPCLRLRHTFWFEGVLGGDSFSDQGTGEPKSVPVIHLEMEAELFLDEDSITVQIGQSNPFGFSSHPAQRFQWVLGSLEMHNHP